MRVVDETGKRYSMLVVLERTKRPPAYKLGGAWWKCRCDCGKICVILGGALRKKNARSCGCLFNNRTPDETGKRYGMLVVLGRGEGPDTKAYWECRCDCGKTKAIAGQSLRSGNTKSCGCLLEALKLPKGKSAFNKLYQTYKRSAKQKGREWALTKEQVDNIMQQNCHYCAAPPSKATKAQRTNGQYIYNGMDRQDTLLGYTLDNVAPCCKTCNIAKHTMTIQEFKDWICRVYNHLI